MSSRSTVKSRSRSFRSTVWSRSWSRFSRSSRSVPDRTRTVSEQLGLRPVLTSTAHAQTASSALFGALPVPPQCVRAGAKRGLRSARSQQQQQQQPDKVLPVPNTHRGGGCSRARVTMAETVKYVDDEHKSIFLKLLNEQRLEGEHCDIAVVVEDVKFRAHRCVLAACSNYFKKLFKKHEVDNSSVIEIDFIRSDIFEEVLNYMYTAKISVKKRDVNLMMSSGQILGIRFLDKLCSQKRDVSSEDKEKFPYDIVKMALPPEAQLAADSEVLGEHDDTATTDELVEASANQELDKSPSAALRVQEAILKELTNEDVHKVTCYDQDVVTEMEAEPKVLGAEHHATQTLTFADSMGEVKDEQPPGWSTATTDMKFEYLLYGHREQLACQVCGKTFLDESRLRKHEKLHSAERPFACEICTKAFTTHAHLKEHLKIHTGFKPYRCDVCGKSFIRAPDLKKHERVHSNERPFACQMCDKAFKHKSHLKDHERRHRGEKPFVCPSCTKAFAKASDLKRHENNMHSERKQLNPLQSDTETLQAAAMAAEEQHLDTISCS
ncbi:zinc finger and BTB domain-containing protein 14 isoform X2 [Amphiprion ocellaris]|uniref:Zinc finger and BTB domain containing 14 n=2 Tax=Amphiprion ocellaris TaxID=80972 RepID=A0A3Q1CCH3_AMPOC|nr:zinc finger and BTB domain-containing protein 14 isoform X2 [Amphiprion ocellaris]